MESSETHDVYDHYEKMLELLGGTEKEVYAEWTGGVDSACSFNLNQPLITRNPDTKLIQVNFDHEVRGRSVCPFPTCRCGVIVAAGPSCRKAPRETTVMSPQIRTARASRDTRDWFTLQLVAVLREVKYLEIRATEEIPGSAKEMYSKNDTFRQYVANLDLTVQWYNKVSDRDSLWAPWGLSR